MQWLKDTIGTPVECLGVKSEAEYLLKVRAIQRGHGITPRLDETGIERVVHVSDGRWLVDCDCGNGCFAHPGDGTTAWPRAVAACTECGRVYVPKFPSGWKTATDALLARPDVRTRHWFPDEGDATKRGIAKGERTADLERENRAHGLPARKARGE